MWKLKEFLGKRTLLVGEAGTGKTGFLARFLDFLVENRLSAEVTLIDIAPERVRGVGGLIEDYTVNVRRVRYLRPGRVWAPRLMGKTGEEVLRYAEENRENIQPLVDNYLSNPTPTLLINDITIYFHAGNPARILRLIQEARTFMATAYEGRRLEDDKGSGITAREREGLNALKRAVDQVISFNER